MRWEGHVTCIGERRVAYRILVGRGEGRPLGRLSVDGSIIVKWIFKKRDGDTDWTDMA
jgi:hypothetical protein